MKLTNMQAADNARRTQAPVLDSAAAHDHPSDGAVDPVALAAESRDFASVLRGVTRSNDDHSDHDDDDNDRTDSRRDKPPEKASTRSAREVDRSERAGDDERVSAVSEARDAEDDEHAPLAQHTGVNPEAFALHERQTSIEDSAISGVRSILHIVDLERVVAAARAQVLPNGRQEVTLELSRSVLEGLRVKLSRNTLGQISAEFIAASERTKAQLDSRTIELAYLLRSRGIAVAELRATVGGTGAESNAGRQADGDASQHDRRRTFHEPLRALDQNVAREGGETIRANPIDDLDRGTGSTYRA